MKKALFMLALYLVPFLSVKANNIFQNGDVATHPPDFDSQFCVSSNSFGDVVKACAASLKDAKQKVCESTSFETNYTCAFDNTVNSCFEYSGSYCKVVGDNYYLNDTKKSWRRGDYSHSIGNYEAGETTETAHSWGQFTFAELPKIEATSCPPEDLAFSSYTFAFYGDDGEIESCSDPEQINQVDSCNASSGNEYLTIDVSAPQGCFPQPDGSICKYESVDVGGGNEYYALDLEGDCYSENDYPDLEGTPEIAPVGEECADYGGGVVGCPEDPENVCTSGSSYAGGSVQDCQTGCGMVSDQFICIDQDSDNDGVPDYKDEDSDDNADCPVGETCDDSGDDSGTGECPEGETCTGGGGGAFDDSGIVAELKKSNKFLETMEKQFKTDHGKTSDELNKDGRLDTLDNDYKLELDEFIAKGSKELGFVDELKLNNMSTFAGAVTNRGCNAQSIDIPSYGSWSIDFCELASKVEPILYFVFGILTVSFIFYRVNDTLRL